MTSGNAVAHASGSVAPADTGAGAPERWEHGSDFHYLGTQSKDTRTDLPDGLLLASGRDAMRCLLQHGHAERGWSRLWLPSYFCQDVVRSMESWGGAVELYRDGPGEEGTGLASAALQSGDVVLLVNFFGLAAKAPALPALPDGVVVVEDHTHDPWSDWARSSNADYCVASLRKTLPLPDGGILWSPRGHPLPAAPPLSPIHEARAAERFAAMALKAYYLAGGPLDKDSFRRHYIRTEARIDEGPVSAISPYAAELSHGIDAVQWREARRSNFDVLSAELAGTHAVSLLPPASGTVPYMAQLRLRDAGERDRLRAGLIQERIYPAVLWPLKELVSGPVPEEHLELSRRLLGIHCDGRYDADDMLRVAGVIRTLLA